MRAAFQYLARDFDVRLAGIVALVFAPAAGIMGNAAGFGRIGFVLGRPPVGRPFPDIADHVVKAVTVRRESCYRRGTLVTVLREVFVRKSSLPGIGHMLASGHEFIAPGE